MPEPTLPARAQAYSPAGGVAALLTVVIGALVAVALGVFGKLHEPRFFAINLADFSSGSAVKAWLATLAVALAVFQLAPAWMGTVHVWSGRLAVLVSIPVAAHCLYALGFQSTDNRVLFHSLFGCLFYGVFVTKMLLLTRKRLPSWVIPVARGHRGGAGPHGRHPRRVGGDHRRRRADSTLGGRFQGLLGGVHPRGLHGVHGRERTGIATAGAERHFREG